MLTSQLTNRFKFGKWTYSNIIKGEHIFTAVDQFSAFLVAEPIPNKDALTVAKVIFKLVTQYGVCDIIISDRGAEATASAIKEVCKRLDIRQAYTPSFIHHCLGSCQRTHRTFAEGITPYYQAGKQWEDMIGPIVFSMNCTVNESLKYSPFEIIYGTRPKFPLSNHVRDQNLNTVPKDCHEYLNTLTTKLEIIRNEVKSHVIAAHSSMLDRQNTRTQS